MIIQCEQCQTRFRLADEKLKPTGTKVRCSKCKHVFTVMPPEPEPPEETVDFDAMNMEAVAEPPDAGAAGTTPEKTPEQVAVETEADRKGEAAAEPGLQPAESELDFSGLQQETNSTAGGGHELADDFSFAAPESEEESHESDFAGEAEDEDAGSETGEPTADDLATFEFGDLPTESDQEKPAEKTAEDFRFEDVESERETGGERPPDETSASEDFSFGEAEDDTGELQLDMPGPAEPTGETEEFGMGDDIAEFSFDEEPSLKEDETDQWREDTAAGEESFEFDEPDFSQTAGQDGLEEESFAFDEPDFDAAAGEGDAEKESFAFEEPAPEARGRGEESAGNGLQFGEIDLQGEGETEGQTLEATGDFTGASFSEDRSGGEEPETRPAPRQGRASEREDDARPLAAPPAKRKGPFSKVLLLLFLLLLALGGAAGYFYLQDGGLNFNRILERFTGQAPPPAAEHKISINITDTSYISNRHAGQLLAVEGKVVNNYPTPRSAITVKGVLLDSAGKPLYQQTVFCGNPLDEETLRQTPYAKIEEAMNNQFGDSLANMDVAPGAAIPFTIVFRNLPEDIASINVEVVGSKPGSS